MSAETPAKDQDKFVLRLPDGMRDRLKQAAEENRRSMNAEIVARLDATLKLEGRFEFTDYKEFKETGEQTLERIKSEIGETVAYLQNLSNRMTGIERDLAAVSAYEVVSKHREDPEGAN